MEKESIGFGSREVEMMAFSFTIVTKKKLRNRATIKGGARDTMEPDYALKRWKSFAIIWPLLCVIFAGIIICQPSRGGEERIADSVFTIIPLIFFAMGMSIRYRLLKERRYATVLVTATVISTGRSLHVGKKQFFPVYEFQVGEITYKVTSQMGYGACYVKEGEQVELYYAPENPQLFYVPIMQKHDSRIAALLCGIGIVWPLIGLFAPQLRSMLSFLE